SLAYSEFSQGWCTFVTEVHPFAARTLVLFHFGEDLAGTAFGPDLNLGTTILYVERLSGLLHIDAQRLSLVSYVLCDVDRRCLLNCLADCVEANQFLFHRPVP